MTINKRDPDFLVGYEIHKASWGYLFTRAGYLNLNFEELISRLKVTKSQGNDRESDEWGFKKQSTLHCPGRIILNVWRLMRSQLTLTSYTLENIVFHILHQRIPKFTENQLCEWYDQGLLMRWRTIDYYIKRVQYTLALLQQTELLSQTTEFARVYGIGFFSAVTRGVCLI
jgi:DNA polymerase elongation subunit (family B)